ncbi:MAG: type II secretion system F family protein [Candidatus Micrarchaeota archaeon]
MSKRKKTRTARERKAHSPKVHSHKLHAPEPQIEIIPVLEKFIENAVMHQKSHVHQAPAFKQQAPAKKYASGKPLMHKFYFFLSKFTTRSQRNHFRQELAYAGVSEEAEVWLGQVILLALLCGGAAFMAGWVLIGEALIQVLALYFVIAFMMVFVSFIVHLNAEIDDRKRRLEEVLPEALQVVAANLRAGMSPVVALRASARPEMGPLQEEIKLATTKSLGTESFTDAMHEMARKTTSAVFQKIVALFTASLKSGGHLALLLENTAADLREAQELKKELVSSTKLYAAFILFTVIIGTPMLLSVSIHFSEMVLKLQQQAPSQGIASELSSVPLISTPLSPNFLNNSALVVLLITSVLASALLGVINRGNYSTGLKYAPMVAASSIAVFIIVKDYVLRAILPL